MYALTKKKDLPTSSVFSEEHSTLQPTEQALCLEYAKYKYEHKAYLLKDFSWQDFKTFKPMPEVLERYIAIRKEKQGGEIL